MAQIYYKIPIGDSYADAQGNAASGSEAITFTSLQEAATFVEAKLSEGEHSIQSFISK